MDFKEFYQWLIDRYVLPPDVAAQLLENILAELEEQKNVKESLQLPREYEMLIKNMEREDKS